MQKASIVIAERIESVIDLFGKVASWLTLSIVLLIVINVILRYSMSLGSVWAQELEWHLLAAMILFGISFSLLRGDNVRVDLFYANYTPQKKYMVDLASAILTIIIAVFFVKLSINYVGQSFSIGEKSPDPGGIPMRWLVKSLIPIGFSLLALQGLAEMLRVIMNRPVSGGQKHV
ncbi:TRAP transporter small permease subunit [Polynucleobacter sp. MWH-UH24A]|uniref:TRAP transporter small permease subunit n=1 Tax=Polynucleobacter sp. MWH-UH24A TaxID=2689110 RepID=UPI001BFD4F8A|nr:TRAP transporter small permease subunit [Polynucleobacter sp. MWH-UH24A]QWD75925.1 TRAP transporter small permease subunit [Polynucleobacter sp. MWH-UH24A]